MSTISKKYYILNYVFIIGLVILFLNDHFFKLQFSNWITGKLSDFVGLFILPFFISYFSPNSIKRNILFSGLFFIFWKSSYSQPFIDFYNQFAIIKITRVKDFSDLMALISLPVSYLFIQRLNSFTIEIKAIKPLMILIPSIFIFMATSPPYYYTYMLSSGELRLFKCTKTINMSKKELLETLRKSNLKIEIDSMPLDTMYSHRFYWNDSIPREESYYPYFKIDSLFVEDDTITNFQFSIQEVMEGKTKIWINGMDLEKVNDVKEIDRKLKKHYKKLIKSYIQQRIKEPFE